MKPTIQIMKSYLDWAPMSLGIREVSRIHALKILNEEMGIFRAQRILDVGCGDGKWWTHIIPDELSKVHGIDVSSKEIDIATTYISAQKLDVTSLNFQQELKIKSFDLIIGNCSLEHVYNIDMALKNIYQVLEENGTFILLIPTPYWALKGKTVSFLNTISPRLSMSFSGLINGFFQHWHLYNYQIWTSILSNIGFKVKNIYGLGNSHTELLFRLGLPGAFISFLVKCLTGKYLNYFSHFITPDFFKNKLSEHIVKHLDHKNVSQDANDIFEYIIVCKK